MLPLMKILIIGLLLPDDAGLFDIFRDIEMEPFLEDLFNKTSVVAFANVSVDFFRSGFEEDTVADVDLLDDGVVVGGCWFFAEL